MSYNGNDLSVNLLKSLYQELLSVKRNAVYIYAIFGTAEVIYFKNGQAIWDMSIPSKLNILE